MRGLNWHQVLGATLIPLGEGLSLPPTWGFRRLKVLAAQENTAPLAVVFDTQVRRSHGCYTLGLGEPLPDNYHLRLAPGDWDDLQVAEELDVGQLVYGVAEAGQQDLYVMAYR